MTQGKLKNKIKLVLKTHRAIGGMGYITEESSTDACMKLINQHVKEVIGEDEYGYGNKPDKQSAEQEIRSELRAEQRKRAGL